MAKKSRKTHEVSALRMPGFNAEASLYGSPAVYYSSVGSGGSIGTVQPAWFIWPPYRSNCYCTPHYCTCE
jgi:hypothetical protein